LLFDHIRQYHSGGIPWAVAISCLSQLWLGIEMGLFPSFAVRQVKELLPALGSQTLKASATEEEKKLDVDVIRHLRIRETFKI